MSGFSWFFRLLQLHSIIGQVFTWNIAISRGTRYKQEAAVAELDNLLTSGSNSDVDGSPTDGRFILVPFSHWKPLCIPAEGLTETETVLRGIGVSSVEPSILVQAYEYYFHCVGGYCMFTKAMSWEVGAADIYTG